MTVRPSRVLPRLAILALVGCGSEVADVATLPPESDARWVENEPAVPLELDEISTWATLASFPATQQEGSEDSPASFDLGAPLGGIHEVKVAADGGAGRWALALVGPDEEPWFHRGQRPVDGEALFRVDTPPRPTGTIRLTSDEPLPQHLEVEARGRILVPSLVDGATEKSWKIDLDHEVRSGFLVTPTRPVVREVLLPEGGPRLLGAVGVFPEWPADPRFVIRIRAGRRERTVEPDIPAGTSGRWSPVEIDLSPWAGERVRIGLEVAGGTFGLWGGPRIVAEPRGERPDLLLISLDTLRADRMSLYGAERKTTPRLEDWAARRGIVFEQAIAASPWTLPSHFSLFTGLDPFHHGVNHDVGRDPTVDKGATHPPWVLLAEILQRNGWSTAAITGGAYLHPGYGFARGFDSYRYWPDRARARNELSDGLERGRRWLETCHRPCFLFLHTYQIHDPYLPREPWFSRWSPRKVPAGAHIALTSPKNDPEKGFRQVNRLELRHAAGRETLGPRDVGLARDMYDAGIAHADRLLGGFLDDLDSLDSRRRRLTVITSDHGEALGESGELGHVELRDHTLRIPLVFALPDGRSAGARVDRQVGTVDVFPTVLELLGAPLPLPVDGVSLAPLLLSGRVPSGPAEAWSYSAAANRGLSLRVDGRWKYLLDNTAWPPAAPDRLHDLVADPTESRNVIDDPAAEALRRRVVERWATDAAGLRLFLRAPPEHAIVARLEGPMVRAVGTKSVDNPPPPLRWIDSGLADLDLPAGREVTLTFEKVFGSRLVIDGRLIGAESDVPFRHSFDLGEVEEGSVDVHWAPESGWSRGAGKGGPPLIRLEWNGTRSLAGESPAASNPGLREQLEALGYL